MIEASLITQLNRMVDWFNFDSEISTSVMKLMKQKEAS